MKRSLKIGFWTLFGASLVLHFYIGGVVVDTKIDGSQHSIMLRENRDVWLPVSMATYWAYLVMKYAMLTACAGAAAWALWRWLWHGGWPKS